MIVAASQNEAASMRVLVVGTGAVGGLYGGMLARAGAEVTCLCRSDFDTVRTQGIRVQSVWGDFHFRPAHVVRRAAEFRGHADYIFVALKVLPNIDTAALIADAVQAGTTVVLAQNGVDIEPPIARTFPNNEIVSGLAFVCCNRVAPGHVHHLDYGRLTLGTFPRGVSPACRRLCDTFAAGGVPVQASDNVVVARWRKLVWNAPFNPMSVVGGAVTTRDILDNPEAAAMAREVMHEVCHIAAAAGAPLPPETVEKNMDDTQSMTPYQTSMLLDFQAGRPMEVEAILGNAVRAARRHHVPAPRMECLYALLQLVNKPLHSPR